MCEDSLLIKIKFELFFHKQPVFAARSLVDYGHFVVTGLVIPVSPSKAQRRIFYQLLSGGMIRERHWGLKVVEIGVTLEPHI